VSRRGRLGIAALVCAVVGLLLVAPFPGRSPSRAATRPAAGGSVASESTTSHWTSGRASGPAAAPGPAATPRPTPNAIAQTCPTPATKALHAQPAHGRETAHGPKTVALTFDDGPSPTATPEVLAILKKNGIAATFFVVGKLVVKHPALVRAIVAEGSLVGNHTYHHYIPGTKGAFDRLPGALIASEVDTTTTAIEAAGAPKPCFFRAPGGYDRTKRMVALVRARGLTIVNWTYDPRDWAAPKTLSASYQALILKNATGTAAHPIVLDHDGSDANFRGNTVAVLQQIIDYYRSNGYTFTDPVGRPLVANR